SSADSVRDISNGLRSTTGNMSHMGISRAPSKSNLSCWHRIEIKYIQPGRLMQNGYIERINRTFRESILDAYLFEDTQQVQILAEKWIKDYNYRRIHESLGGKI